MFDTNTPSTLSINIDEYKDKVLGCWSGKNIGGTLGAPFEGRREMNDATFYTQKHSGEPLPNDDLDLQLVWLNAVEENGLYNITPRLLGEYWANFIVGPWNEYSVCKANIAKGLYPPLSGSCNNDIWKHSNGAWIRSEIWACLFPGSPDNAAEFAYMDACCDHCGDGIYAEIFTASLESAAFVVGDIRRLIEIGLSKIPGDCRVARSVRLACSLYDKRCEFKAAREAIVKDSEDLGWFQAPANLGFVILGLLYGEGDFSRSVCLANNCGDDTDCTAATVGSILGVIMGRSGIPAKWMEPIGESIKTVAINRYNLSVPETLGELTRRVITLAVEGQRAYPSLPMISSAPTSIPKDHIDGLLSSAAVERRIWGKSPYELTFDLPFGELAVDYEGGPSLAPGEEKRLKIAMKSMRFTERVVAFKFELPEGWSMKPGPGASINCVRYWLPEVELSITAGAFPESLIYIPLHVRYQDRLNPVTLNVPFELKGAAMNWSGKVNQGFYDARNRQAARRNSGANL